MGTEQTPLGITGNISALVDGELSREQALETLELIGANAQATQAWHAYHVVGDVMRSEQLAPRPDELAFLERLQVRLAEEPDGVRGGPEDAEVLRRTGPASNDPVFHWKALAMVSSIALALTLAVLGGGGLEPESGFQIEAMDKVTTPVAAMTVQPQSGVAEQGAGSVMVRDPELDALLAAHQQMGGTSALQGPSGFLRNATYTRPAR